MGRISFVIVLTFSFYSIASAIEVGGHLTEDTIWSPENNPYLVTSGVYVDEGVTLRILPGTIIKFNSVYLDDSSSDDFWFVGGEEPVAKFIRVDGRIIAEGTEQDSITFTRAQDSLYYHWGSIYISEDADPCSFNFCKVKYSFVIVYGLTLQPEGICTWNGSVKITNSLFQDNSLSIEIRNFTEEIEINHNTFKYVEAFHPNINPGSYFHIQINVGTFNNEECESIIIADNFFHFRPGLLLSNPLAHVVNNTFYDIYFGSSISISGTNNNETSYIFNNDFIDFNYTGINSGMETGDSLFIKNNRFYDGNEAIHANYGYLEISDNYLEECDMDTGLNCSGKVYNNVLKNSNLRTPGYLGVYQNINFNGEVGLTITYRNELCFNNLSINNQYAINGV